MDDELSVVSTGTVEKSAYNDAQFQAQRLHFDWIELKRHIEKGDMAAAHYKLDSLWYVELESDVSRSSKEKEIREANSLYRRIYYNSKKSSHAYWSIIKRASLMRKLADEVGKGAKWMDSSAMDFE